MIEVKPRFRCYDCGNTFDECKVEHEDRGEFWGMPAFEDMYYCPHCGSENFEEFDKFDEEYYKEWNNLC